MTTTQRHLTRLTMLVATLAAAFTVHGAHAAPRPVRTVQLAPVVVVAQRVPVVQLASVVVVAQRMPVVQLERVVVVAKRAVPAATVLAQRAPRGTRV